MHFNWCATAIGVPRNGCAPIDGGQIPAGDAVIALRSAGFRSNGFSLVRSILEAAYGPSWHDVPSVDGRSWGEVALTPSFLFTPSILALIDAGIPLRGVAHITGGGIPSKFGRVLKRSGLGARLDRLFAPHDFMQKLLELGNVGFRDRLSPVEHGQRHAGRRAARSRGQNPFPPGRARRGGPTAGEIAPGPIVIQGVPFHP